jgi:imidazolonepropionase-like amidohydrolase
MIDGLGGPPVAAGVVAVAGERIVYAGPAEGAPPVPPGARQVDLPDACLLPGLIDSHVHPTYFWEEPDSATYTYEPEDSYVYSEVTLALLAARNLREALRAGVTTARDTGSVNQVMMDVRRAVEKGWISGPRMYVAGRLIVPTGGHVHYLPGLSNEADGPDGLRRAVRQELRAGADYIKLANNGADLTQEELNAAVDEAHRLGKKVACHTSQPPSQRMAIEAGVDTFEHGTPSEEEVDVAVEKGIAWTPTINISQACLRQADEKRKELLALSRRLPAESPELTAIGRQRAYWEEEYRRDAEYLERKRTSVAYAVRAGLRLLAGTDSWMAGVSFGAIADEICWLAALGCPPLQAIQAATLWPAEAMGWPDLGALACGRYADVIAVADDPLASLAALRHVILVVRGGQIVHKGDNM